MIRRRIIFAIIIFSLFTLSRQLFADKNQHIDFTAVAVKSQVEKGEKVDIRLTFDIHKYWYTYSMNVQLSDEGIGPTTTEIIPDKEYFSFKKSDFKVPKPNVKYDKGFEMDVETYKGTVVFVLPVTAKKAINFNETNPKIEVYLQQCDTTSCLPPLSFYVPVKAATGDDAYLPDADEEIDEPKTAEDIENERFIKPSEEKNLHASIQALPSKISANAGEDIYLKLILDIKDEWNIYDLKEQRNKAGIGPSETSVIPSEVFFEFNPDNIAATEPKTKHDDGFDMDIKYFNDKVEFLIPVKLKTDVNFEEDNAKVEIIMQQFNNERSIPPESFLVTVSSETFTPDQAMLEQVEIEEITETESGAEIQQKKEEGILSFLWFAMAAGAGALLTPCVFPMIPITVSFFAKRSEKEKGKGLRDSLLYALGIISTFTALGFILALLLGATGIQDFATNPWVNLFIAGIFVVFAFNLFGAFEIQLPTGLMNTLNKKSQGSGIISVILMGLTFSLTSFTCTVPFVGTALISAASGEWFHPIIGMLGFSTVFALPFFFLALFPTALQTIPKAGGWMNNIKVVMGFLEIAAAIKFISNAELVWDWGVLPRELFLSIWIGASVLISIYILGFFRFKHDTPVDGISTPRAVFSIFFISMTFWLFTGLQGNKLGELDAFLPPYGIGAVELKDWYDDLDEAKEIALREEKPIFVDFTGFTCTNCRWMEQNMFPKPQVRSLLNDYVKVHLFTDRREEPYISNKELQQEMFNSIELPLYVIMTPSGKPIATKTFTRDQNEFTEFLEKGKNSN